MKTQKMKTPNLLILQSSKATFDRFYNNLHFSLVTETDVQYEFYKKDLGVHFIKSDNLLLYKSNCHVWNINPGIYEKETLKTVLVTVKETILSLYFDKKGISYNVRQKINNGTKDILIKQFPNINTDESVLVNTFFRHSVIVNDDSTILLEANSSILANENTLSMLLNYKNDDNVKRFSIQQFPCVNDNDNYSLFHTISNILYNKPDNAILLKFAVSYFYDVVSRLDPQHPFFREKDNAFFLKIAWKFY
jgi:hypothetical protein